MLAYLYAIHAVAYAYALTLAGHTSLVETRAADAEHAHSADDEIDCIDFSKAQDAPACLTTPPLDDPLDGIEF